MREARIKTPQEALTLLKQDPYIAYPEHYSAEDHVVHFTKHIANNFIYIMNQTAFLFGPSSLAKLEPLYRYSEFLKNLLPTLSREQVVRIGIAHTCFLTAKHNASLYAQCLQTLGTALVSVAYPYHHNPYNGSGVTVCAPPADTASEIPIQSAPDSSQHVSTTPRSTSSTQFTQSTQSGSGVSSEETSASPNIMSRKQLAAKRKQLQEQQDKEYAARLAERERWHREQNALAAQKQYEAEQAVKKQQEDAEKIKISEQVERRKTVLQQALQCVIQQEEQERQEIDRDFSCYDKRINHVFLRVISLTLLAQYRQCVTEASQTEMLPQLQLAWYAIFGLKIEHLVQDETEKRKILTQIDASHREAIAIQQNEEMMRNTLSREAVCAFSQMQLAAKRDLLEKQAMIQSASIQSRPLSAEIAAQQRREKKHAEITAYCNNMLVVIPTYVAAYRTWCDDKHNARHICVPSQGTPDYWHYFFKVMQQEFDTLNQFTSASSDPVQISVRATVIVFFMEMLCDKFNEGIKNNTLLYSCDIPNRKKNLEKIIESLHCNIIKPYRAHFASENFIGALSHYVLRYIVVLPYDMTVLIEQIKFSDSSDFLDDFMKQVNNLKEQARLLLWQIYHALLASDLFARHDNPLDVLFNRGCFEELVSLYQAKAFSLEEEISKKLAQCSREMRAPLSSLLHTLRQGLIGIEVTLSSAKGASLNLSAPREFTLRELSQHRQLQVILQDIIRFGVAFQSLRKQRKEVFNTRIFCLVTATYAQYAFVLLNTEFSLIEHVTHDSIKKNDDVITIYTRALMLLHYGDVLIAQLIDEIGSTTPSLQQELQKSLTALLGTMRDKGIALSLPNQFVKPIYHCLQTLTQAPYSICIGACYVLKQPYTFAPIQEWLEALKQRVEKIIGHVYRVFMSTEDFFLDCAQLLSDKTAAQKPIFEELVEDLIDYILSIKREILDPDMQKMARIATVLDKILTRIRDEMTQITKSSEYAQKKSCGKSRQSFFTSPSTAPAEAAACASPEGESLMQ